MKDQNMTLPLPYYFFLDGVMIEPEWIVRITNGIIGWSCTKGFDNPEDCGLTNCVFR
jgi:hypothetical protein